MAAASHMIFDQGFRNVVEKGVITGFQLNIQVPTYHGAALSIIQGMEVTVDGETFKADQLRFTTGGRTYTLGEMAEIGDDKYRWPWLEPGTVTVLKPGGLKVGVHDVQVRIGVRSTYMETQPSVSTLRRSMTIMQ